MIRLTISFFVSLALTGLALAQGVKKDNSVSFRILTFSRAGDLKEAQFLQQKKSIAKVKFHKNNFSEAYQSRTRTIVFYKITEDLISKPPAITNSIGNIQIPVNLGKKVLLIAFAQGKKYQFIALKDTFNDFRNGEFKLINLTNKNIGATINNKKFKLKPKQSTHLKKISTQTKAHSFPVEFYFQQEDGGYRVFSTGYWQFDPEARKYSFFYLDPKTKRIRVKSIRDFKTPSPPAETKAPKEAHNLHISTIYAWKS